MIPARAHLGAALDALAREAGLLERSLLGEVLDVGRCLDPVRIGGPEELVGELALGFAAVAMAARARDQRDPDVPGPARTIRAKHDPMPADRADRLPGLEDLDDQRAVPLVAERALRERLTLRRARNPEVVELAERLRRLPGVEEVGVIDGRVAQADAGLRHRRSSGSVTVVAPRYVVRWALATRRDADRSLQMRHRVRSASADPGVVHEVDVIDLTRDDERDTDRFGRLGEPGDR